MNTSVGWESYQSQGTVLLCDDSKIERSALSTFLRGSGYHVDEVGDGLAAMEYLKTHNDIGLILLDLQMPEPDGFSVLSYVQEHRKNLPIILLSGMPPDEIQHEMHRLKQAELPPLLIKPVDPQQLLQVIDLRLSGQLPTGIKDAPASDVQD